MMRYFIHGCKPKYILFLGCFFVCGLSYCYAGEKKKIEPKEAKGVMIVSLNAPMRATIGDTVFIEVVIGNERMTKVTTILTVTCLTTDQLIGREAETLDGLSSQKIVYAWDTKGLKEDSYLIQVELEKAPGETYLDDNTRKIDVYLTL
ncbi:MAG: hypothetical protein E3K32_13430 [wastewater metagenome]|nr:hypothetical protein [Candidatus Loosdrechtia aerotolerans]